MQNKMDWDGVNEHLHYPPTYAYSVTLHTQESIPPTDLHVGNKDVHKNVCLINVGNNLKPDRWRKRNYSYMTGSGVTLENNAVLDPHWRGRMSITQCERQNSKPHKITEQDPTYINTQTYGVHVSLSP